MDWDTSIFPTSFISGASPAASRLGRIGWFGLDATFPVRFTGIKRRTLSGMPVGGRRGRATLGLTSVITAPTPADGNDRREPLVRQGNSSTSSVLSDPSGPFRSLSSHDWVGQYLSGCPTNTDPETTPVPTTNATPPPPEFLTAAEAAQFARISYSTLKRLAKKGVDVGSRKVGRRVLFEAAVLRQFLASGGTPTAE